MHKQGKCEAVVRVGGWGKEPSQGDTSFATEETNKLATLMKSSHTRKLTSDRKSSLKHFSSRYIYICIYTRRAKGGNHESLPPFLFLSFKLTLYPGLPMFFNIAWEKSGY